MSRLSSASSVDNGHRNGGLDFHSIGQACLAGLKEANNDLQEMHERCNSLEQDVAQKLGDMDLRVTAVESGNQAQTMLANENQTLKHSLDLLSKSIDPGWKSDVEHRLQETELVMQKMEKQIAAMSQLLQAKLETTNTSTPPAMPQPALDHSQSSTALSSSSRHSSVHPNGHLATPPSPSVTASASHTARIPPDPALAALPSRQPLDKHAVHKVVKRKSRYAAALDTCLEILGELEQSRKTDLETDDTLLDTASSLLRIDFSAPLVDRKAFEHKRDWVTAWQQALEQVQNAMSKNSNSLSQRIVKVQAKEQWLEEREQAINKAGNDLKEVLIGLQEDCDSMAAVEAMLEDHQKELIERLRTVEEQEELIRQDQYIISNKGKRAYEKDAADYRRVEELRGLKRELENRIAAAIDCEQRLLAAGRRDVSTAGRLPRSDDIDLSLL